MQSYKFLKPQKILNYLYIAERSDSVGKVF